MSGSKVGGATFGMLIVAIFCANTTYAGQQSPTLSVSSQDLLSPWQLDWRHAVAWRAGHTKPRAEFAPPGCYITRLVTVCHKTSWRSEYICR